MKKRTINAFTLVEMLIVIVIIGILIAALMPRMQAAQWRARDVSRKTALSQIQSAIVTSQWDKWRWPGCDSTGCVTFWQDIIDIQDLLQAAWMNSIPNDPIAGNKVTWLWNDWSDWQFRYLVTKRNWTKNWWFVLMAKTEVEWWSNRIVCNSGTNKDTLKWWKITSEDDINQIHPCDTVSKLGKDSCTNYTANCEIISTGNVCCYQNDDELRYVVVY